MEVLPPQRRAITAIPEGFALRFVLSPHCAAASDIQRTTIGSPFVIRDIRLGQGIPSGSEIQLRQSGCHNPNPNFPRPFVRQRASDLGRDWSESPSFHTRGRELATFDPGRARQKQCRLPRIQHSWK